MYLVSFATENSFCSNQSHRSSDDEFRKSPSNENSQLFHHHVSEQFVNSPLSAHTRRWSNKENNSFSGNSTAESEHSWLNIANDGRLPSFDVLSLRQILELLQDRWKVAFHKPSESVSTSFTPVHNILLFDIEEKRTSVDGGFIL